MIDRVLNAGDKIWLAHVRQERINVTCPICFGKLKVTLILGDDSQVEVECDYCGKGFEGPQGYVTTYEFKSDPVQIEITGRGMHQSGIEEVWTYQYSGCYIANSDQLFKTQAEAVVKCVELVAEHEENKAAHAEKRKQYGHKSYTWAAGYHLREIKSHEHQLAWHQQRVQVCKAKSRLPIEKNAD